MHILLSNDDGILAPGLLALHDALAGAGHRVTVVAPWGERSAMSHAIVVWRKFPIRRVDREGAFFGWAVDSNPADCVKFALSHLLKEDLPDVVVSGINPGPNIGDAVFYSGTVGAAAEGALYGVPGIAVSLGGRWEDEKQFAAAADFTVELVENFAKFAVGPRCLLNVNVPNAASDEIAGVVVTRMGTSKFIDFFKRTGEENGTEIWRNQGTSMELSPKAADLDDWALEERYISVTPLRLDLTDYQALRPLEAALGSIDFRVRPAALHRPGVHEDVEHMSPFPAADASDHEEEA